MNRGITKSGDVTHGGDIAGPVSTNRPRNDISNKGNLPGTVNTQGDGPYGGLNEGYDDFSSKRDIVNSTPVA